MDVENDLMAHLNYLSKETRKCNRAYGDTIEILYKLHRFILRSPVKTNSYIRLDSRHDYQFLKVWRYESVRLFMFNLGWRQEQNILILRNARNLKLGVNVLRFFRRSATRLTYGTICPFQSIPSETFTSGADDDHQSQGFTSEAEQDVEDVYCDPKPIVTFESENDLQNRPNYRRNKPRLVPYDYDTDVDTRGDLWAANMNLPKRSLSAVKLSDLQSAYHHATNIMKSPRLNPFLNAASAVKNVLAAVTPLGGATFQTPPQNAVSHFCESVKQLMSDITNGVVSGLDKCSTVKISSNPDNSVSISSPRLFGPASIHIKSESNTAVFNLISDCGQIATGISLMWSPDGSVLYSKNSCSSTSLNPTVNPTSNVMYL